MKKIKLRNITLPAPLAPYTEQTLYRVYLGNGYVCKSPALREAKRFLAETNRFLNVQMHELNLIYCDVFRQYRRNWFYFSHAFAGAELISSDRDCREAMRDTERIFDLLIERSHHINGNFLVFAFFKSIIGNLDTVIGVLTEMMKEKSNGVDVQELQAIKRRIRYITFNLNRYPELEKIEDVNALEIPTALKAIS